MSVHNHGPDEGPGIACRESLIGDCLRLEAPLEMFICEARRVCLKPGQLYRFKVDRACRDCRAAAMEAA